MLVLVALLASAVFIVFLVFNNAVRGVEDTTLSARDHHFQQIKAAHFTF